MRTDRTDFNESWLMEMPENIGTFELYDMINYNIKDVERFYPSIDLGSNYKKIDTPETSYYWYEKDNEIILGAELLKKPQALIVKAVGKKKNYRKTPPYASDLYDVILHNSERGVLLLSDTELSNEGYSIWKKLFSLGHKISIYDKNLPGKTFQTFNSLEEMDNYFSSDNRNYQRYQYILSEDKFLGELKNNFNNRRFRELINLPLVD
jgi:hypothetical protein